LIPSGPLLTIHYMEKASLEQLLDGGLSLAEIGRRFGLHESTVGYWVGKHGLQAVATDKHAAKGPLSKDELERLVDDGASIARIAERVKRSKSTVRHWLKEYGLRTHHAEQRHVSVVCVGDPGSSAGDFVVRACPRHGLTTFKRRSPSGYRCLKCRSQAVTERRRRVKQQLVQEAGGACQLCGYDKCLAALEFHHIEPLEKRFALSHRGVARSIDSARAEASKCVLLCANCHAEVESGFAELM
jgi:transposase/5-methylcytosine-specific restriction endonuclease McrA